MAGIQLRTSWRKGLSGPITAAESREKPARRELKPPRSLGAAFCLGGRLVLAVRDQVVDNSRIGKRRGVAQRAEVVLGDFAQDAAHDLAGAGLRKTRCKLDLVGRSDWADLAAN